MIGGDRVQKNRRTVRVLAATTIAAAGLWVAVTSWATDVGVIGSSVSISQSSLGKRTLKSLQKDPNVHFGAAATPAQISASLEVHYVDTPANKAVLPLPSPWKSTGPTTLKFSNSSAPAGPTAVRTAVVKAGKLAKIVAKGLGGLDIATPPGAGGVVTVLTITNAADGSTHRLCSKYATGSGSSVLHRVSGSGYKLILKRGVPTTCPSCSDGAQNGS